MFHQQNFLEINECLACGSKDLTLTLDLNTQPLANNYKKSKSEVQDTFPLALNRCNHCFHLQLTHAVNPELMFKNYLYVSGTSKTYLDYMNWYAGWTGGIFNITNNRSVKSVIDIGCNDGSQLNFYADKGIETVGIDPAENLYEISSKRHKIHCTFFNKETAEQLNQQFDIITMQNAFAHQYNPLEFLEAIKIMMHDESLVFLSTSQANMVINNEFDTIYHEHINFYNINSMYHLANRAGLHLINVYKTPIHGTSYVFILSKNQRHFNKSIIEYLIKCEAELGLQDSNTYIKYQQHCENLKNDLITIVEKYANEHRCQVVGYGAAAKGMTLLNYSKLKLDFIVDDNPLKQGTFTPGSDIPIVASTELDNYKDPILFVPLAWNFYKEIVGKIKTQRKNGNDKFCTYFPEVKILN